MTMTMEEEGLNALREIIVDNFAGGGGASTGIETATGRSVDIAINHDQAAIAMHKTNHPETEHYCESVWDIDPRVVTKGRPVGLCWLSPDCKHFSKAKGGTPVEKKIRGLAWVAVRWAATVKPRVIILENVEEFVTWGPLIPKLDPETGRMLKIVPGDEDNDSQIVISEPGEIVPPEQRYLMPDPKRKGLTFKTFVNALKRQGYQVEWKELRACDYGAPTIRKRLFLIARCDGKPIVWPHRTHGDPKSAEVKSGKLKAWRVAAEIIDWSIPCPSIFDRKKPLAENTLKRIARGLKKFVLENPNPFIIKVNHKGDMFRGQTLDEPMQTITAKNGWGIVSPYIARIGQTGFGKDRMQYQVNMPLTTIVTKAEHLLITPTLIQMGYGEREGQEPRVLNLRKPLGTVTAGGNKFALATALITRQFGKSVGHSTEEPLGTITAGGGGKSQLVAAFLAKHYGGNYTGSGAEIKEPVPTITTVDHSALVTSHLIKMRGTNIGHTANEPVHTITAGGLHLGEVRAFLLKYYGSNVGQNCNEPIHTVTTKDRFGLITIHGEDYQIVDIGMRMLEPHELFAAQGFPSSYAIDIDYNGTRYPKSEQVARCGNAVPPPFAKVLVSANLPELCYDYPLKEAVNN